MYSPALLMLPGRLCERPQLGSHKHDFWATRIVSALWGSPQSALRDSPVFGVSDFKSPLVIGVTSVVPSAEPFHAPGEVCTLGVCRKVCDCGFLGGCALLHNNGELWSCKYSPRGCH